MTEDAEVPVFRVKYARTELAQDLKRPGGEAKSGTERKGKEDKNDAKPRLLCYDDGQAFLVRIMKSAIFQ